MEYARYRREDSHDEVVDMETQIESENQHRIDARAMLILTGLLVITILVIWVFKQKRIRGLHETGVSMLIGMLAGFVIDIWEKKQPNDNTQSLECRANASMVDNGVTTIEEEAVFDPEVFFYVLLPPIIFFAGYDLKQKHFFRNIGAILTYAFLGTTISCFATGLLLMVYNKYIDDLGLSLADSLSFGAFISATDPVTVLAIYHDLHVDNTLYALVFGESVMNDAVALVLFSTIERMKETEFNSANIMYSVLVFLVTFFGSFACGCIMGMGTSLITKFTNIGAFPLLETTLFVLLSYMTFLIGEATELSGIVAVLFCGITQAHYTYPNLSDESKIRTKKFFELLNLMAENFIFSYIGVSFFTYKCHRWEPTFIIWSIFSILIARVIMIYPLTFLLNLCRKEKSKITRAYQHCLVAAGLRGAIAFALAMSNRSTPEKQMILSTTLIIVLVTVLFFGGGTMSILQILRIRVGIKDEPSRAPSESTRQKGCLAKMWQGTDKKYLKPFFSRTENDWGTHNCSAVWDTIMRCCRGQESLPVNRDGNRSLLSQDSDDEGSSSDSVELSDLEIKEEEEDSLSGDIGAHTTLPNTPRKFTSFEAMSESLP
eukprot:m.158917 g.158917  ORF g.158917 m.158917 type:complete len:602 (+) comp15144_c0_seq1:203-2008(+)